MTDEEMAEEYFEELRKKKIPFNIPNVNKEIKQAYLAGLKARRPEWHKVTDGDLPKEEGEYLVCYETEKKTYRNTFILNYTEYDESLHWCDESFETFDEGVIAWCEIPKYTEVENICCNCGYYKHIASGKEPCKSCDNGNNYQDKTTPCYYSRKGENNYKYSSMGIIDPENYDYISARQYHERYEDTE